MKKIGHCSTQNLNDETGCHIAKGIQTVQPFPTGGLLAKNSNLELVDLQRHTGSIRDTARSYIVDTVRLKSDCIEFEQRGSAPNFQGDVLTLCTCKHQMRSRLTATEWANGVWIAGFTSRTIHARKHWLFYLAKVKSAHESHSDLWNKTEAESRDAKAAHTNYLGDIFKPAKPLPTNDARFTPSRYVVPRVHAHSTESNPYGVIGRFKTSHSWALQNQQRCECSVSALKLVFRTRGIAARLCFSGS